MNNNNETFNYTYSATEQEEVRKIREKYIPKSEDKLERLRALDESVTKRGTVVSVIIGILGTLIFGIGMCCCLVWASRWFVPGIIIGVFGIALTASAYPIYSHITAVEREKIAPEIIKLTDELMK